LQIFISFYVTTTTIYIINKGLNKASKKDLGKTGYDILQKKHKKKNSRFKNIRKRKHKKKVKFKSFSQQTTLGIKKDQKVKNKKDLTINKRQSNKTVGLKGFQEIILESLLKYTKNKVDISVTLQNINRCKQLSDNQINNLKTVFKQLRKFVRNSFYKEAINILFVNILKRKSAKLLAEFISDQFRLNQLKTDQTTISRKDNYFLGFLKQIIMLFVKYDASCLTGVKVTIKGRFNRAPRAKTAKIHFGKCSLQSLNSKIDYYQSTSYTNNGTFGIKV